MEEKIKKEIAFKVFIEDLSIAYREFCLNRVIHEKVGDKFYTLFQSTWDRILVGLQKSYLLGLARLFDKYRLEGKDKNISIYFFLDYKFINQNGIINKLKKLRNKMLCHSDLETTLALEKFLDDLSFKEDGSDIESLFRTTIETINEIGSNFAYNQDIKQRFEKEKNDVRDMFSKWFEVFQKGFSTVYLNQDF